MKRSNEFVRIYVPAIVDAINATIGLYESTEYFSQEGKNRLYGYVSSVFTDSPTPVSTILVGKGLDLKDPVLPEFLKGCMELSGEKAYRALHSPYRTSFATRNKEQNMYGGGLQVSEHCGIGFSGLREPADTAVLGVALLFQNVKETEYFPNLYKSFTWNIEGSIKHETDEVTLSLFSEMKDKAMELGFIR